MTWQKIRPVAVAAVTRPRVDAERGPESAPGDVEVLLAEHYDPGEGDTFYRPPGGGLEFGEHSSDALVREFDEEMGVTLRDLDLITTMERTFTFDGTDGHEIWFLYDATIAEDWPYERDRFTAEEPELDEEFEVVWKPLADFAGPDGDVVYPEELPELL